MDDVAVTLDTYDLELYFSSKNHSGGGPIESFAKKQNQLIIEFEEEEGVWVA